MKIRVVTWNIHKGVTGLSGRLRIHAVQQGLQVLDADIVCLQEVQNENLRLRQARWRGKHHPIERQLDFLAQDKYPHHAYGLNAFYSHGHHGNAVLSKLPLSHWENIDISDHRFEDRGLLHTVLHFQDNKKNWRNLHVISLHLGLFSGGRRRQTMALVERMQAKVPHDEPLIIAGDFNDWRNHLHDTLTQQLQVKDAFVIHSGKSARTFPSHFPALQLDRLYVRGCQVERAWVPDDSAWRWRSDHAPLCAELILPSL